MGQNMVIHDTYMTLRGKVRVEKWGRNKGRGGKEDTEVKKKDLTTARNMQVSGKAAREERVKEMKW